MTVFTKKNIFAYGMQEGGKRGVKRPGKLEYWGFHEKGTSATCVH